MSEFRFKENKVSEVLGHIGGVILLSVFILPIIVVPITNIFIDLDYIWLIAPLFIALPICCVFFITSSMLSDRDKFTREFLKEIRLDVSDADTEDKLWEVRYKLWNEAVGEDVQRGPIRLSFPLEIKEILKSIDSKIELIQKIK